jgi:hypothetical protein
MVSVRDSCKGTHKDCGPPPNEPNWPNKSAGETSIELKKQTHFGIKTVKTGDLKEWDTPNTPISQFLKHCLKLDHNSFTEFIKPLLHAVQETGGTLYITGSVDEALQILNSDNMSEADKDHYLKTAPFPGDFDISIVFPSEKIKTIFMNENCPLRKVLAKKYGITNRPIEANKLDKGFVILRPQHIDTTALPLEIKLTTENGLDTGIPVLNHRTKITLEDNCIRFNHFAPPDFIPSITGRKFSISKTHIPTNLQLWQRILRLHINGFNMTNRCPREVFWHNVALFAKPEIEWANKQVTVHEFNEFKEAIKTACSSSLSNIFSKSFLSSQKTIHQALYECNDTLESQIEYLEERKKNIKNFITRFIENDETDSDKTQPVDTDLSIYKTQFRNELMHNLSVLIRSLETRVNQLQQQIEQLQHKSPKLNSTDNEEELDTPSVDVPEGTVHSQSEQNEEGIPAVNPTKRNAKKKTDRKETKGESVIKRWEDCFSLHDKQSIVDNDEKRLDLKDYDPTEDINTLLSESEYPLAMNVLITYLSSELNPSFKTNLIKDTLFVKKIGGNESKDSASYFSVLFKQYLEECKSYGDENSERTDFINVLIPVLKDAMTPQLQTGKTGKKKYSTPLIDPNHLFQEVFRVIEPLIQVASPEDKLKIDNLFGEFIKKTFDPKFIKTVCSKSVSTQSSTAPLNPFPLIDMICLEIILTQLTLKPGDFDLICSIIERDKDASTDKLNTFFSNIRIENFNIAVAVLGNFLDSLLDVDGKEKPTLIFIHLAFLKKILDQLNNILEKIQPDDGEKLNLYYIPILNFVHQQILNYLTREISETDILRSIFEMYPLIENDKTLSEIYLDTLKFIQNNLIFHSSHAKKLICDFLTFHSSKSVHDYIKTNKVYNDFLGFRHVINTPDLNKADIDNLNTCIDFVIRFYLDQQRRLREPAPPLTRN